MTAGDGMKVHTRSENAAAGPGGGARVHPAQPPARLPGLRQGRRVPAAGPDLPLRARQHALPPQQAHLREAARDLAADRARPRALHPLLPLHALLAGRRPGRAAGRARARRELRDRDVRGASPTAVVSRATSSSCARSARSPRPSTASRRGRGRSTTSRACAGICAVGCNTWGTVREGGVQRILSRNHPEVDEGWLCDRGRFTHGYLPRRRPLPAAASCAARAASSRPAPSSSPRPSRAACATTPACTAPTRSRSSPRASRATRRPTPGPSSCAPPAAARSSAPASRARGDWDALAPYAARIADLDRADVIVVSGERELGDAAGVLELRVRQAVRRGARLLLAGSGGGDLDHVAGGRIARRRRRARRCAPARTPC